MPDEFLRLIRDKARKKLLFLPYALDRMLQPDRRIDKEEVKRVVLEGEIIENYPEDTRGHSFLMFKMLERPLHVVCAPKDEYLAIITVYLPVNDKRK
jgi:hypothetical protein